MDISYSELNIIICINDENELNTIIWLQMLLPFGVIIMKTTERNRIIMTEQFSEYLRENGKSENTIKTYCRNISLFLKWCRDSFGEEPTRLYRANVLEYISYMRNIKQYDPRTVNNHLSSLKTLNAYFIKKGIQNESAVLDGDFMKVQIQYASPCTVEKRDVESFRQRLLEHGSKRDYAIVTLYVYTGIRRSECVSLRLDQVDLISREIRIVGKGNKQRIVYINDKAVHAIREYLKERDSDSPYLFVSRQSEKLTPSRINQIFNKYSDTITPKTLRHYFCSNALENGYSIHEVANQAGHSNVQTTLIYSNPTAKEMKDKANRL